MKVPGKSANEPTWFQFLSQVCSFYGVGAVKAGKKVVDNRGLTLVYYCILNTSHVDRFPLTGHTTQHTLHQATYTPLLESIITIIDILDH